MSLNDRHLERLHIPGEARVYALESVGTLTVQSWRWRSATARTDEREWEIVRRGFWKYRWTLEATDAAGVVVGHYEPCGRWHGGGGALCWGDRRLTLRSTSRLIPFMFVLADGKRELVRFEFQQPHRPLVSVKDWSLDPGLLLFAVVVVRRLLSDGDG